jgi:cytochrome c553
VRAALRKGRWAFVLAALFVFPAGAQDRAQLCAACHGPDGNSPDPRIPSIAAQPKPFLENQLILFREGLRRSEQMAAAVSGLKDAEITRLAEHFSRLPAKGMETGPADSKLAAVGESLSRRLRCGLCHLRDYSGQAHIPRLAGQRESYLDAEMRAYRDGKRSGGDTIMAAALYGVSDADITALAHYLSRSSARSPAR